MADFRPFTTIYLIKDVDIDVSYNHQYYFESQSAQYNFFFNKRFETVAPATYQHKNSNTILVPFLADNLRDCKYMMWRNLEDEEGETSPVSQPHKGWYYAFVTGVDFIAPDTALIHYQLDVYQTYLFDVQWKQSFVEREHTQRYENRGEFVNLPVINTEDEGLEMGAEYQITDIERLKVSGDKDKVGWLILGFTDIDEIMYDSVKGMTTGISYGFVPVSLVSPPSGTAWTYYAKTNTSESYKEVSDATNALKYFATDTSLVNSLVSAYFTRYLPFDYTLVISGSNIYIDSAHLPVLSHNLLNIMIPFGQDFSITEVNSRLTVYEHIPDYSESKLCMYPYSFVELTTNRGQSVPIKMEYLNPSNPKLTVGVMPTLSTHNKTAYLIKDYLGHEGYCMENGIQDSSNMNVPFQTDNLATLIQSSGNAIDVAQSNAKQYLFSAYDNASTSYGTALSNSLRTYDANEYSNKMSAVSNLLGTWGNTLGDVSRPSANDGQVIGAIGGALASSAGTYFNYKAGEFSNLATNLNAMDSASTTYANAMRSALTSYKTTVASVLAKVNDARQIPPTASSTGGDYLFNMSYDCDGLYAVYKTVTPEYASKLSDYFKQYGYKVNRLEEPNFHTREHWNYIKMAEPNVYGNIPMDDLMAIRGIFMNGITLWHGDYIGDYNMSNNEI